MLLSPGSRHVVDVEHLHMRFPPFCVVPLVDVSFAQTGTVHRKQEEQRARYRRWLGHLDEGQPFRDGRKPTDQGTAAPLIDRMGYEGADHVHRGPKGASPWHPCCRRSRRSAPNLPSTSGRRSGRQTWSLQLPAPQSLCIGSTREKGGADVHPRSCCWTCWYDME